MSCQPNVECAAAVPTLTIFEGQKPMKWLNAIAAFILMCMCGSAFAQNTGPAPQTGMEKPGMTNGAKQDGSMDTTGMSSTKGNIKREKDGAPAAGKKDDRKQ
jgi:hypothetical protein